jgi:1,4-alpha-glucan branching enzyme
MDTDPARHLITLPEGSWGEGGYHYIWLNEDNAWCWEKLYPCQRKMIQMAREYAEGPAEVVVIQAARELLLAESSDWQFLISTKSARDYSEIRFADHIDRFTRLSAIADRVHGGEVMKPEEEAFLLDCQEKDAPFPKIDLRIWQ